MKGDGFIRLHKIHHKRKMRLEKIREKMRHTIHDNIVWPKGGLMPLAAVLDFEDFHINITLAMMERIEEGIENG